MLTSALLSRPNATPSEEIRQAAAVAVGDADTASSAPTENEVKSALKKLKNGTALGCCNIAPEMLKAGGPAMVTWLTAMFQSCWANRTIPEDWKK